MEKIGKLDIIYRVLYIILSRQIRDNMDYGFVFKLKMFFFSEKRAHLSFKNHQWFEFTV